MGKKIVTAGGEITDHERNYVLDAVNKMGDPDHFRDYVDLFEKEFAKKIGVKHALATVNGTGALHLGLLSMGIGPGDEVILPDMTYIACANVIHYVGAKPVLVDIDPFNWTLCPDAVKKAITKRTKAIMPVWMYGSIPHMAELKKFGIPIIEDSCPAFGSYHMARHAGTIGQVGAFSFQGAKLLVTGEGGMLVTNSDRIIERARRYADMCITKRQFWHDKIGYMYEMAPVLAAIGYGQLQHADEMVAKKKLIYQWYSDALEGLFPMNYPSPTCNYWMTSIVVPDNKYREGLRKYLKQNGVDTRPFFYPISMFGFYKTKYKNQNSYDIGLSGINLPSRVDLSLGDVEFITSLIKEYARKGSHAKTNGSAGKKVAKK